MDDRQTTPIIPQEAPVTEAQVESKIEEMLQEQQAREAHDVELQKQRDARDAQMRPIRIQYGGKILEGRINMAFFDAPEEGILLIKGDKQTESFELKAVDVEERARLLQQMMMGEDCTRSVYLGETVEVIFRLPTMGDNLEAYLLPPEYKAPEGATQAWWTDFMAIRRMANTIASYAGKTIGETIEQKVEWLTNLHQPVFEYLKDEYNAFQADVNDLLQSRNLGMPLKKS